ncbi:MAG TPA: Gfo/Idh/MocA family oxidoreductase, partial [Limnochordia bacterium]|nr:Gfo/Idh/MocA family oxidoreductase [Limnochordia bacterium]
RALATWRERHPEIAGFDHYDRLLEWGEFDAVFLATPVPLHAPQALAALAAGKHVLSEVVAATTLDECWALVEAVERTGLTYMMAENYCYQRANLMVLNMVEQGVFGQPVYAEGAYIHDTRNLTARPDGSLTWRGELHRDYDRNRYPTHSLGPVSQWLRINRPGGDRLASTVSYGTDPFNVRRWFEAEFGPEHPGAKPGFFRQGDSTVTLIRTERGALITIRVDSASARPHNMTHYQLQGTHGAYLSPRYGGEEPLIWLDGRSPGTSPPKPNRHPEWQPLWTYAGEFEHPYWREFGEAARSAGHGGGDFFVLRDFIAAIQGGARPAIDVYDAVTVSSIIPLSERSIAEGGTTLEIPDFARGNRLRGELTG